MGTALDSIDFALDEMPGEELHDVLRAYREERGPVAATHFLGLPAFVISSHEALLDAFRDVERFPPHLMYELSFEGAVGRSFISMGDAKEHLVYRKLATPAFRSRALQRFEAEGLAPLASELVDDLGDDAEVDLVEGFSARLPYLVISRMLGLPRERESEFHGWAKAQLAFRDDPVAAEKAKAELTNCLAPVVEARRSEPRDDVISELVAAEVDGRSLSDEEIHSHVRLLFPTGGETTYGSLGNLLFALLCHEGEWERLARDPSRIDAAVEEALRWETPIAVLPRRSGSQPARFRGVDIPADSWVLFAIAGANRDPAVFDDPDSFRIGRDTSDALTFGRGVKSCPGLHLARRSMATSLRVLLERMPRLELVDLDAAIPRRSVLRSPDALRVCR